MDMQLKSMKKSRRMHKMYASKIIEETNILLDKELESSENREDVETDLNTNLELLNIKMKVIENLNDKISELLEDDDEICTDMNESGDFQRYILKTTIRIEKYLKQNLNESSFHIEKPASKPKYSISAKLPKLTLPKYSGDPMTFQSFWDSFDSAIHSNQVLNDISKFNYLKSLLEGNASLSIQGLAITGENYRTAIKILKERFGDEQVIISAHMDALLNIQPTQSNKVSEIRTIFDLVEIHTKNLELLNVNSEDFGPVLVSLIMSKLPKDFKLDITRKMPQGKWKIIDLMNCFREELIARERCISMEKGMSNLDINQDHFPKYISTLHSQQKHVKPREWQPKSVKLISCSFCKGKHPNNRCNVVTDCNGKHHISICDKKNNAGAYVNSNSDKTIPDTSVNVVGCQDNILLQTAKAEISDTSNSIKKTKIIARVLFDNCSQKSFVTSDVRKKLNLKTIRNEILNVKVFGESCEKPRKFDLVSIKIKNIQTNHYSTIEAYVTPIICSPIINQRIDLAKLQHTELANIPIADDLKDGKEIDILIGANYYWSFVTGQLIRANQSLTAVNTILGWTLNGNVKSINSASVNIASVLHTSSEPILVNSDDLGSLGKFWELEDINEINTTFDLKNFYDKIQFNGKRYSVPLPWKQERKQIPDNYEKSKLRLLSTYNRLKINLNLLQQYNEIIRQQEHEGIIERIPDFPPLVGQVHYLPHHAVIKEEKSTTKLRIVFDASSNSPSLNDCLEKGPCLLPMLIDILIRFGTYKIAVASDIEKAFLNIAVNKNDRDFLRFLWFDNVNNSNPKVISYRYTRVLFGMNSSQFLLLVSIMKHLYQYKHCDPEFVNNFLINLYVDDSIAGGDTSNEVLEFCLKAKSRLKTAGLNLRKWRSNNSRLISNISSFNPQDHPSTESKILGITWDTGHDKLSINLTKQYEAGTNKRVTKRNVLKIIASIYDPIGIISPLILPLKLIFQKICTTIKNWDKELNDELKNEWNQLMQLLSCNLVYEWHRYFFKEHLIKNLTNITIHGFCDASKSAYAAVVFITAQTPDKQILGRLIASKTKISPLKPISIPKLELSSCLLLSSLMACVIESLNSTLKIENIYCWSDAMDALCWIKNSSANRNQFITNRITKIKKNIPPNHWRFCPGKINPADLPSRGLSILKSGNWFENWMNGPEFLYQDLSYWPAEPSDIFNKSKTDEISNLSVVVKVNPTKFSTENSEVKEALETNSLNMRNVINVERFSSLHKLFKVTAYVLKFIISLKHLINKANNQTKSLCIADIRKAEILWIRTYQCDLSNKVEILNNTLGLFVDEDKVVRCKGRLQNSILPYNAKHPILLPSESYLSELLICQAHKRTLHAGVKETLCQIRSKYWILRGRKLVRSLINKCSFCKRLFGKAFTSKVSPPLPHYRVTASFPFQHTGVDYLGPLHVKPIFDDNSTEMYSVHVVLFTCATTRAVHLDLVPDLSAKSFVLCLKRFIGRRGIPNLIISDNATCFKNEEVKLSEELLLLGIDWKYIIEAAPWWGGFWERLVQSVKKSLLKVVFRSSIRYDELEIILCEIEGLLNSRPITYAYHEDTEEVLTPSHLMHGRRLISPNETKGADLDKLESKIQLTKRMKYLKLIRDHFWVRFTSEYLVNLREFHKQGSSKSRSIELGEIVVIHSDIKRYKWRLGKVVSLITGSDNIVRSAIVKVLTDKTNKQNYIKRPIEKLYPIEVKSVETVTDTELNASNDAVDESNDLSDTKYERPVRIASRNGILIRRLMGQF
nr:uncharacterized protein LOC124816304 [Hydra vulgaris]